MFPCVLDMQSFRCYITPIFKCYCFVKKDMIYAANTNFLNQFPTICISLFSIINSYPFINSNKHCIP